MGLGWTEETARPLLDEALKRKNVTLIANALGTPPSAVIDEIHASGRLVAALCGKVKHAIKHKEAGVDIIIAQGSEGGGHTGDVGSMVLWPLSLMPLRQRLCSPQVVLLMVHRY